MNPEYKIRFQATVTELETDIFDLPLHQIERMIGLGIGVLSRVERACDSEQGRENDDSDFAEYEGKRSLKLWALTEYYLYDYSIPADPLAFITARFFNPIFPAIDAATAAIIVDLITLLHENEVTSYVRFAIDPLD